MRKSLLSALVVCTFITTTSCKDDNQVVEETSYNQSIENISNNVIIATYKEMNEKALALKSAIQALTSNPNATTLQAAKDAWVATRKPWEQSEGFLYGPVDTEGIDPAIDTWPVDVIAMNNVLNSNIPITAAVVSSNNEARGFHLIEFLLWGENSNKTADQITDRQKEYLNAAAADLQNNTQALYDGWIASGGNFVNYFLYPNINNPKYKSEKAVILEMIDGIITIADEVVTGKIQTVLDEGVTVEESRFSNNSKADFTDNIRSIQNVYLGKYGAHSGKGISVLIASKNPSLDNKVKNAIAESIQAIEGIPGTFTTAVTNNTSSVENARDRVLELKEVLEEELLPYFSNNF